MKSDFTMWFLIRVCVRTLMDQTWIHWMIRSMISIWIESKERFESQKLRIESDFSRFEPKRFKSNANRTSHQAPFSSFKIH